MQKLREFWREMKVLIIGFVFIIIFFGSLAYVVTDRVAYLKSLTYNVVVTTPIGEHTYKNCKYIKDGSKFIIYKDHETINFYNPLKVEIVEIQK